ncbi:ferritin-like protein [Streptomyces sp. ISL-98]|uniref:ferritin-like domain-containing protein n=1 Tax=Streptomyces sp. ISL-98 TaxID=2819192 RepID=UPI001BEB9507|nr:ferritin-like protein [Streptomyces sp. ISL-98]MBT2505665.1 ferritin-like protein [Streptomyces sp. ISL-98]
MTTTLEPTSIVELLDVPPEKRGLKWIHESLQTAVTLELSTLPPYLCAWWSVKDPNEEAAQIIRSIVFDEMFHMGLACNMLASIGGIPQILTAAKSLKYPGELPGRVRPGLEVYLSRLNQDSAKMFMAIEKPEHPLAEFDSAPTIGKFYDGIRDAFMSLPSEPQIDTRRQMKGNVGDNKLTILKNREDIVRAINVIKEQGEGTDKMPNDPHIAGELAHYYKFGEIAYNKRLRLVQRDPDKWEFKGGYVKDPDMYFMAKMEKRPWPIRSPKADPLLMAFNKTYTETLRLLEKAWADGDETAFGESFLAMKAMRKIAVDLMQIKRPDGEDIATYGPEFLVV